MRELASPRSGFLRHLTDTHMPKHEVLRIIEPHELADFYREMAGALIEIALREHRREHRRDTLDGRAIMTQVRSSKYHKANRVAKIIETFYEQWAISPLFIWTVSQVALYSTIPIGMACDYPISRSDDSPPWATTPSSK